MPAIDLTTASNATKEAIRDALDVPSKDSALASVNLVRPSMVVTPFVASEDTNDARMAALSAALEAAELTPDERCVITLVKGVFAVADGLPLASFAPSLNVTLAFEAGASLRYATPSDAASDVSFFPVGARHLKWFGLQRDPAISDLPAIQAARFSLPEFDSPLNEYGEVARGGTLDFDGELAYVDDTVWISQYQTFANGGICAMANFAPNPAAEKFIVDVPCRSDAADANYTHDVKIIGFYITANATGNSGCSALLFAGAQTSEIDLKYFNIALRGVVFKPTTTFVKITRLDGGGNSGPGLEMVGCNLITIEQVSFNSVNSDGAVLRDGRFSPAVWIENTPGVTAHTILTESCAHGVVVKNSDVVTLSYVDVAGVSALEDRIGVTISGSYGVNVSGRAVGCGIMIQDLSSAFVLNQQFAYFQPFNYTSYINVRGIVIHSWLDGTLQNVPGVTHFRPDSGVPAVGSWKTYSGNAANNPAYIISSISNTGVERQMVNFAMAHGANYSGYTGVWDADGSGGQFFGGKVNTETAYRVNGVQVIGARQTGWTTMTGGAAIKGGLDVTTVTLPELARIVKGLIDASLAHGMIGPSL